MTKETKKAFRERFVEDMAESLNDLVSLGLMDDERRKMTMREFNRSSPKEAVAPLTGSEIKELRETAKLSQAVFARYLNLTVDHISKLERGAKRPTGPALVLLDVIRRKGIEAIL